MNSAINNQINRTNKKIDEKIKQIENINSKIKKIQKMKSFTKKDELNLKKYKRQKITLLKMIDNMYNQLIKMNHKSANIFLKQIKNNVKQIEENIKMRNEIENNFVMV